MKLLHKIALTTGLIAGATLVRAEVIALQFDAKARFERDVVVAPGKFVEVCGALPAGALVQWRYEAAAALDFNIHYHVGSEVHYPNKLNGAAVGHGMLKAETAQDYCWMWTHKGKAPVTLQLRLTRAD